MVIDTRRHDHGRQLSTGTPLGFSKRIVPGGHHERRPVEHRAQGLSESGEPSGDRDLGAVQDHAIPVGEPWPDHSEWDCRIEQDERRPAFGGQAIDSFHQPRIWEEDRLGSTLDVESLTEVERDRPLVRRGVDVGVLGRQSLPELEQIVLDPSDLGREVVRDEQVRGVRGRHDDQAPRSMRSASATGPSNSARTDSLTSVRQGSAMDSSPQRRAAHTACARNISSGWER